MKATRSLLTLLLALTLYGCVDLQYYRQSIEGHMAIVWQKRDIQHMLEDENLDAELREKLQLVVRARAYAANTLQLSFNDSFSEYVDLHRSYVVRNLYVAPEFSTELYSWCYPVIGCANYRGFFDGGMLKELEQDFNSQGYDTYISNVTAYSTLGWFADPVLSTFIALDDFQLVALVLHELAHQQVYVNGDTFFNESFARSVEQAGVRLFFATERDSEDLQRYFNRQREAEERVHWVVTAREELNRIYARPFSDAEKRKKKQDVLQSLEEKYAASFESPSSLPPAGAVPASRFNNARLGAVAAYHKFVPAFLAILESHDANFEAFYAHVGQLGELPQDQRTTCLTAWSASGMNPLETKPTFCLANLD